MKHLRIFNLIVVLLLLAAWTPLPQSTLGGHSVVALAYTGSFSSIKPVAGTAAAKFAAWPDFSWVFTPTNGNAAPAHLQFIIAYDKLFTNLLVNEELATGTITYKPTVAVPFNKPLFWKLQAVSTGGAIVNSKVTPLFTYPEPVTSLDDVVVDSLFPELKWAAPSAPIPGTVKSYTVELAENETFTLNKKPYSNIVDNRFDVPVALKPGMTYWWHVMSVGSFGTKTGFSTAKSFTTPSTPPPSNLALLLPKNGAALKDYKPLLVWKCTAPCTDPNIKYQIQFSTSKLFSPSAVKVTIPDTSVSAPTPTSYLVKAGELPTGVYYWRVQAYIAVDNTVSPTGFLRSGWSKPLLLKTPSEISVTLTDPLRKDTLGNPLPMSNTNVWVTSSSTCRNDTDAYKKLVQASATTNAEGKATLTPITGGTRYICAKFLPDIDYADVRVALKVAPGTSYTQNIEVTKPQMIVYLTWSYFPSDLDMHLWLPTAYNNEDNGGHVYTRGVATPLNLYPYAKIASNDASSTTMAKKTETLTIANRYPGDYTFAVRNVYGENWNKSTVKPYVMVKYNNVWVNFENKADTTGAECTVSSTASHCRLYPPATPNDTIPYWWYVFNIDGDTGYIDTSVAQYVKETESELYFPYDQHSFGYSIGR